MPKSDGEPKTIDPRIDKRVKQFIFIRDEIKALEDEHEKALAPLKDIKRKLEGEMLDFLDKTGQKSAKTAEGIATIVTRHTASCSDPDLFMTFVRENDAYELIDRRANATACRDYAQEHGNLPPGVKLSSMRTIGVTRP